MKKKTLWFVISMMSIALLGLSSFQFYWISNVIKQNNERFEGDVYTSLNFVASRLEALEMMHFVRLSYFSDNQYSSDPTNIFSFDIQQEQDFLLDSGLDFNINTTNGEVSIFIKTDTSEEVFNFESSKEGINKKKYSNISANTGKQKFWIQNKAQQFSAIINQMMVQEVERTHRLRPQVIDSLLKASFRSHGIDIFFEFGVLAKSGQDFVLARSLDRATLINTPLRANLFPNDVLGNGGYLLVSFPNKAGYLFKKIWAMMATSVIFLLIIIGCFTYAIIIIFKQKKLSDLKNDFINNMTHEFKTPISTVSLACEALEEREFNTNKATLLRYVGIIKDENKRLGNQVEKVLQIASLEKHELELAEEVVDIHKLINTAMERAIVQVESKGGTLTCDLSATDTMVLGDELHLINVVFNLLDNATKYSTNAPNISILTKDVSEGVLISVTDEGIGMSKEQIKHVFEKFYRVPTGNIHDVKGFGLGLSYVRFIAEAHHGEISVKSSPGNGSTFNIVIPMYNG